MSKNIAKDYVDMIKEIEEIKTTLFQELKLDSNGQTQSGVNWFKFRIGKHNDFLEISKWLFHWDINVYYETKKRKLFKKHIQKHPNQIEIQTLEKIIKILKEYQ